MCVRSHHRSNISHASVSRRSHRSSIRRIRGEERRRKEEERKEGINDELAPKRRSWFPSEVPRFDAQSYRWRSTPTRRRGGGILRPAVQPRLFNGGDVNTRKGTIANHSVSQSLTQSNNHPPRNEETHQARGVTRLREHDNHLGTHVVA